MPSVIEQGAWVWRAWEILSDMRTLNDRGPQPIQMEAIRAYADYNEISGEILREDFLHLIVALDNTWRNEVFSEQRRLSRTKGNKAAGTSQGAKPRR